MKVIYLPKDRTVGGVTAAAVMTATGYEVMTDAKLREAARADFEKRKGGKKYVCPVPAGQKGPSSRANVEEKVGSDEFVANKE